MKSETIKTFLESLGKESSLDVFKKDVDLDLLMSLSENDLRDMLMHLQLTPSEIKKNNQKK